MLANIYAIDTRMNTKGKMRMKQAHILANQIKNQWGNYEIVRDRILLLDDAPTGIRVDRNNTCVNSDQNQQKLIEAGFLIHPAL